ncbi:choice-of-anchor H family protein [Shewanella olleyana]|uniref:choice-of-anchor H family protein n=1 Tax=Shewanella olleyana TaxID=135626 RepID=UPI00200E1D87|nr:choice-of-anchor H family protein [Shewanella olleyana]MCL1068506.1 choice-of-anchor H family protein [Shewanella olleyana]
MNLLNTLTQRMTLNIISLSLLFILLISTGVKAESHLDNIVVSQGRQVAPSETQVVTQKAGKLTESQRELMKQLIADEKQRLPNLTEKKLSREQITLQRQSGILSVNAFQSINQKEQLKVNSQTATEKSKNAIQFQQVQTQQQSIAGYRDFEIYQAYSRLFDDFDEDGFYQTFSVTFDADVYGFTQGEPANVYAELYLSRNGGPWEHYYSTEVFTIYGDATDDDYEVLTTLAQGYKTDYYDVLIDLYELDYEDIVATLSADESDGLYALPLESSDRDEVYEQEYVEVIESEVIVSGGSVSLMALLMLLIVRLYRLKA